jgi:hypothetical protein
MVDDGGMWSEARVAVGEVVGRCFPNSTRRSEVGGRQVRSARSWRRVGMVVEEGICRGMAKDMVRDVDVQRGGRRGLAYCLQKAA